MINYENEKSQFWFDIFNFEICILLNFRPVFDAKTF